MSGYKLHLVGSIPLRNAAEVFETVSAALGPQLLRIPDGETGERAGWMGWLGSDFQSHPDLEPTDETFQPHAAGRSTIRYCLKPSARTKQIVFDNLRHASVATEFLRRIRAAEKSRQDSIALPLPVRHGPSDLGGEPLRRRIGTGRD